MRKRVRGPGGHSGVWDGPTVWTWCIRSPGRPTVMCTLWTSSGHAPSYKDSEQVKGNTSGQTESSFVTSHIVFLKIFLFRSISSTEEDSIVNYTLQLYNCDLQHLPTEYLQHQGQCILYNQNIYEKKFGKCHNYRLPSFPIQGDNPIGSIPCWTEGLLGHRKMRPVNKESHQLYTFQHVFKIILSKKRKKW